MNEPARMPHPSKIFIREMFYRGWTAEEFCKRSGISMERYCLPFNIDKEFAKGCAKAFDSSAEMWLNLQARWDRWQIEKRLERTGGDRDESR